MPKMPSMQGSGKKLTPSKIRRSETAGSGLITIVLVVVSLVIFTLSVQENGTGVFSTARNVTQTLVTPIRFVGSLVAAPFSGASNIMRNLTADGETLSELKQENERLSARNVELEESEKTAQRLQELLDVRSSYNLQSIAARVISGSTDSWTDSITIDKGSASGISPGMPVVNQTGAIGQVLSCSATTSTVRLISDEQSSVSAMIQVSRAQGMLQGSIDGTLHLQYIRTDQTVNVGDIVVTSGLGGVFPKGLPIGKVSVVEGSPASSYYEITVEPFGRPDNYEEVLIVTSLTEEQRVTSEEVASADAADKKAAAGQSASNSGNADEKKDSSDGTSSGESGSQTTNGDSTERNSSTSNGEQESTSAKNGDGGAKSDAGQ